jgi:hypothetical protein
MKVSTTAVMNIGDLVLYLGRNYYLRGIDPMSVPNRQAFLEDAVTGEQSTAPVEEIEPAPVNGSAGPAGV